MPKVAIINGPNLNLLGSREPQIYGTETFDKYFKRLESEFPNIQLHYFQSNVEGLLIDFLHQCKAELFNGIIINAGGYTHTSIALADAIAAVAIDTVEVHISNVLAREEYRKTSYIASKCLGSISGFGLLSYHLALNFFQQKFAHQNAP